MARAIDLPQASLNRALDPQTPARISTAAQRVRRVVDQLVSAGYWRAWLETGEGPIRRDSSKETAEEPGAPPRSIPMFVVPRTLAEGADLLGCEPAGQIQPTFLEPMRSVFGEPEWPEWYILIRGDAMAPTLSPGGIVPVRRFEPEEIGSIGAGIYLFRHRSQVKARRLEALPEDRLRVLSDHSSYPKRVIDLEEETDVAILGRVLRPT